jgi:hypothetical protein
MPGEQRRTLDAPSQQPVTEIVVKTPQPIQVDIVLINPHDLYDFLPAADTPPANEAWSTNASRLSCRASPSDARLLRDVHAGRIRLALITLRRHGSIRP